MPIPPRERQNMLAVRLCGPRVIARLGSIGITKLGDLTDRDPYQLVDDVNLAAGRPIWHPRWPAEVIPGYATALITAVHSWIQKCHWFIADSCIVDRCLRAS